MDEAKYREFEARIEAENIKRGMSPLKAKREAQEVIAQVKLRSSDEWLEELSPEEMQQRYEFFDAWLKKQAETFVCPLCHRENNYHLANCSVLRYAWLEWLLVGILHKTRIRLQALWRESFNGRLFMWWLAHRYKKETARM